MCDSVIEDASPNGKLFLDIINKYGLKVLNFNPKCTGKWTRVQEKNNTVEREVLLTML